MSLLAGESAGSGNPGESQGQGSAGNSGGAQGSAGGAAAGANGSVQTSWRDSLPEDIRTSPGLQTFSDVGSLAKSYLHAQSLVGKKGVFVPGEKATEEDWQKFYDSVGRPTIDKFDLKAPEGAEVNQKLIGGFKDVAHKAGLLPKQAQGVLDWYNQTQIEQGKSQSEANQLQTKNDLENLRKEWGQGYPLEVHRAQRAAKELGGEAFVKYLNDTGLGNDTQLIRIMAKAGALLAEDGFVGDGSGKFGQTNAEIRDEIGKITGDKNSPYFDAKHADHKRISTHVADLYKKLYPEKG